MESADQLHYVMMTETMELDVSRGRGRLNAQSAGPIAAQNEVQGQEGDDRQGGGPPGRHPRRFLRAYGGSLILPITLICVASEDMTASKWPQWPERLTLS